MNWKSYIRMAKVNLKSRKLKSRFQTIFIFVGLMVIILVNLGVGLLYNMNSILYNKSQDGVMIHVVRMMDEENEDELYERLLSLKEDDDRIVYVDKRIEPEGMDIQSIGDSHETWFKEESRVNLTNEKEYLENYIIGKKDIEDDEIILPKYLFRTVNAAIDKYDELEYIDCEQYIGQTIKIDVDITVYTMLSSMKRGKHSYEFKIAGVYDNVKQCTSGDEAYITSNVLREIKEDAIEFAEGMESIYFAAPTERCVVIVKEHKYVDEMVEELNEMEIGNASPQLIDENNELDKTFQFMTMSGDAIGLLIIMWAVISMVLSYLKDIRNRTSEYGLLKAVGYNEKDLSCILGMETLLIGGKAVIFSLVTGEIIVIVLNYLIQEKGNILWKYLRAGYTWWQIILVIVVGLLTPFIAYYFGIRKIKKINPIDALKSTE